MLNRMKRRFSVHSLLPTPIKKKKEKEISKARDLNQKDIQKFFKPLPVVPVVDKTKKKEKISDVITFD